MNFKKRSRGSPLSALKFSYDRAFFSIVSARAQKERKAPRNSSAHLLGWGPSRRAKSESGVSHDPGNPLPPPPHFRKVAKNAILPRKTKPRRILRSFRSCALAAVIGAGSLLLNRFRCTPSTQRVRTSSPPPRGRRTLSSVASSFPFRSTAIAELLGGRTI